MNNRKQRVISQLGMPPGTAAGRLRKMVLFHLLCRLEENTCFKCSQSIENVDDLSIEHKLPWENRDPKLFWDLNNIAFSHLRCNKAHERPGGRGKRKVAPEGMCWCSYHEVFEPTDNFYPDSERWNGLRAYCKTGRYERVPKYLKSTI